MYPSAYNGNGEFSITINAYSRSTLSSYRRLYIPGGSYFFTLVTYERQPFLANDEDVEELRRAFRQVQQRHPFKTVAGVVLPDHIHVIWTLPKHDCDFSIRWQMIKTAFSRQVPAETREDGSKMVWQPRFFEHYLRDERDLQRHLDYIHDNPVKHGLTNSPMNWPYSSFRRFVQRGWYEETWGQSPPPGMEEIHCE